MRCLPSGLPISILIALGLVLVMTSSSLGWSSGNSCSATTYKICVSEHDDYTVPRATVNGSDSNYDNDKYFNTQTDIANTGSSVQNYYSTQDVFFYTNSGYGGNAFCVDTLYGYSNLGWGQDDQFESHLLLANNSYC